MANMQTYIENFISEHELEESVNEHLIDLINKCFSSTVGSSTNRRWLNNPKLSGVL
jgi:hypothetical protein